MTKTIRRVKQISLEDLTDTQRYKLIDRYKNKESIEAIATDANVDKAALKKFINREIKELLTIQESNKLINEQSAFAQPLTPNKTAFMNDKFLSEVEEKAEAYAFYFAMTGSNIYALEQSGLNMDIPRGIKQSAKDFALASRGRYLRAIPEVQKYIEDIREQRVRDAKVDKPLIQSEILDQIEQMKELAVDDIRYRRPLLQAIDMLGKTIGAFQENIHVTEATTKSGLELLMDKVRGEVYEYNPE